MADGAVPAPNDDLPAMLERAGVVLDTDGLRAVMAGVVSAPPQVGAPDAWMHLICSDPSPELADALRSYRDRVLASAGGGFEAGQAATAERLTAVRAAMADHRLDAMIVPRADAHQGEFVPPHAQRLRWLTGFSGSAGNAVVTRETAALFVDGRYTLQASGEVDTERIAVVDSGETAPATWLGDNLWDGARVGYDPWLHTPDQLDTLRDGAGRANAVLEPVPANPVDTAWPDQPALPISPVVPHDLDYAGETSAAKRGRVAEALSAARAQAVVLTLPAAIAWLLNVRAADIEHTPVPLSFAIAHDDGRVDWFIDTRKLTPAAAAALDDAVRVYAPEAFEQALDALGASGAHVWIDPGTAPARVADRLADAGARLYRKPDPVQEMKAQKNATELAGARAAHIRDGAAVSQFLAWLDGSAAERTRAGAPLTEMEAAEALAGYRRDRANFRDPSFATISGAGEHGAIVHYRVTPETDRALNLGELYLCDSGGQYLDGTTDITRTIPVGEPTAEMRAAYTRVLKGHIALATARFPEGTSGSQLDAFARRPLWEAGMDYAHGTGHGVGSYLGVHEGPQRISKLPSRVALKPGMICSNEPGYYKAGHYGIRIENLVAVTPADETTGMLGFETLTCVPYCRALIEPDLLTAAEIAWIDAYHRWVRTAIRPEVDVDTAAWLDTVTMPLAAGRETR
jgi:Xaa-Pro aminopeptidase